MEQFHFNRDANGILESVNTSLEGLNLLNLSILNKGNAFTEEERVKFKLNGLIPEAVETLEQQVEAAYIQYNEYTEDVQKNIYINALKSINETLTYKLIAEHVEEMLPIIYTPTIGVAVEQFSREYRKLEGVIIAYCDRHNIDNILSSYKNINLVVVTDGEGVLGIGDQGIGGICISIGKLMVYTVCGGLNPAVTLPIQLDCGTNNKKLLEDPLYLGWRHERISSSEYEEFISLFVDSLKRNFPSVFLHWEDFGRDNARKVLEKYRDSITSFNDDIQGTGAVALAAVWAGIKNSGIPPSKHKFVVFGAGTAGVGITEQICDALVRNGMKREEALSQFYLIDRDGLLNENTKMILPFQKPYLRKSEEISSWKLVDKNKITLEDVISNITATVLIGCSTVKDAFTEKIIKEMYRKAAKPVILALSNPTSKAEAVPSDLLNWTDGNALIATGSPFGKVNFKGSLTRVSQCNNAFIFPGLGLGVLASKAAKVTDNMLWAASNALSSIKVEKSGSTIPILPGFNDIIDISVTIARAVALQALIDGVAGIESKLDIEKRINENKWYPKYYPYAR